MSFDDDVQVTERKPKEMNIQAKNVENQYIANQINFGKVNINKLLTPDPFHPSNFTGRQDELKELHHKLFSQQSSHLLFVVNGNGGIGKTSLISEYYRNYKDEYKHVAWILNQSNIADSLLSLAHPLNVTFEDTDTKEERLKQLVPEFGRLEEPSLLVLDNVNELDDLKAHFYLLNQCRNHFHILITSRITAFEDMEFYPIQGLPEAEAIDFFKSFYPKVRPDEDELLKQIINDVERNTLIIELFAKTERLPTIVGRFGFVTINIIGNYFISNVS